MTTASDDSQSTTAPVVAVGVFSRRGILEESRRAAVGLILLVTDWLTLSAVFTVVWVIRRLLPLIIVDWPQGPPLLWHLPAVYYFAPWIVTMTVGRLYSRHTDFWDEVRAVIRAMTWGTLLALVVSVSENPDLRVSRFLLGTLWVFSMPALCLTRYGMKRLLAQASLWSRKVLVVGNGEAALQICQSLRDDPTLGYDPVALVVDRTPEEGLEGAEGLPVTGPFERLPALLAQWDVRDVIVANPEGGRSEVLRVAALCEGRVDSLRIMPDTVGLAVMEVETETIGGHLLISMRSNLARPSNLLIKRATDILGCAFLALPAAVICLVVAALIRMERSGPVFFVQTRVGRGGTPFRCYKFRTMFGDADDRLDAHLAVNEAAREEWRDYKKLKSGDPRVTRIGHYLRRFSLDELPQLLNVMRGEMTLVGPRPYIGTEIPGYEDAFRTILLTWPGVTGLWQVSGRNELTMAQRVRLDEYYVRNWSLWLDLQIFLRTFGVLARGDGAF